MNVEDDGVTLTIIGAAGTTANAYDSEGTFLGSTVLDENGQGTIVVPQSNGGNAYVTLTDAGGKVSPETHVTLPDTLAPDAPVVTVGADGVTLEIEGEPGATAEAFDGDGNSLGTVVLDGSGQGTIVVPESQGGVITVTQTDAAGNPSPETPVTVPDTLAPEAPVVTVGADGVTLEIEGEPGATAESACSGRPPDCYSPNRCPS